MELQKPIAFHHSSGSHDIVALVISEFRKRQPEKAEILNAAKY
jgi:hypothetical protein